MFERVIKLNGVKNLRDLGGYSTVDGRLTRWRTLFRSDCLDQLDTSGQEWLVDSGLRTVIDLRGDWEVESQPNVFATSERVRYRRVPLFDAPLDVSVPPTLTDGYRVELDQCGERLRCVIDLLLEPDALPALVHCAAGKDRTGVVAALVLDLVGVPREVIADDFALTSTCLGPELLDEGRAWTQERGFPWADWSQLWETPPERMLRTLDYLDAQFGGVQAYFESHGLGRDRVFQLHDLLTEPPSSIMTSIDSNETAGHAPSRCDS